MKMLSTLLFAVAVGSVGCGQGAIADTPLTGTFNGTAFTAISAVATFDSFLNEAGERSISISDATLTCTNTFGAADRKILFSTAWTEGAKKDLSLSGQTVTFVSGGSNNNIAVDGRLEIVSAPATAGQTGKLKLRARASDDNVEGAVDVLVCD